MVAPDGAEYESEEGEQHLWAMWSLADKVVFVIVEP